MSADLTSSKQEVESPERSSSATTESSASSLKTSAGRLGSYEAGMNALAPTTMRGPVQMEGGTTPSAEHYEMTNKTGLPAVGHGWGNRAGDLKNDEGVRKSASMPDANRAAKQPNLRELAGDEQTTDLGGGFTHYSSTKSGTATGTKFDPKVTRHSTFGDKITGPEAYAVWGAEAKEGVRGEWTTGDTDYGKGTAKVNANVVASGGADARASVSNKGVMGTANFGGKIGAEASAGADYVTPGLKIEGVDKELNAGVGVGASGFAGAKAGVGGKAGWDLVKQKFELSGGAGAFAGVEGKADVHGHIGPIGGKLEAGGFAGVGAGIDGGIVYEGGKLTIGGRAWAGLGYGGKIGGSVTVDLKHAAQLGVAGAKKAYELADADRDGKLTLNDPATRIAQGMNAGSKGIEKGVDSIIFALDGDGDGKFTSRDVGIRVNQAKNVAVNTATAVKDKAVETGHQIADGARELGKAGYEFLDQSGDGQLGLADVKVGAEKIVTVGKDTVNRTIEGAKQAKDAAVAFAEQTVEEGKKALKSAASTAHSTADRDGDGQLGLNDVRVGAGELADGARRAGAATMDMGKRAGQAAWDTGKKAYNRGSEAVSSAVATGREMASTAKKKVVSSLDASGDGRLGLDDAKVAVAKGAQAVEDTARGLYNKADQLASDAHSALDRDGDGQLSMADAMQAKAEVKRAVGQKVTSAVRTGRAAVETVKEKAYETADAVKEKASAFATEAHSTLDRTGDGSLGLDDVALGASQAKDAAVQAATKVGTAVKDTAVSTYNAAAEQISAAADTISEGYGEAKARTKAAVGKLAGFFGW